MLRVAQARGVTVANDLAQVGSGMTGPFLLRPRLFGQRIIRVGHRKEEILERADIGFGRNEGVMRFVNRHDQ